MKVEAEQPGARVELGGEGADAIRGGDVCRLFPSDSLFRYDEGVLGEGSLGAQDALRHPPIQGARTSPPN